MLRAVANPAAGGQPGSFTTLTVTGAATIGGGLAVTGSISATANATIGGTTALNGAATLGANIPLQFTAGAGAGPFVQHTANALDIKQGTSGLRVLNNAGTVALLSLTDGTTTQMAVTGSISADGTIKAYAGQFIAQESTPPPGKRVSVSVVGDNYGDMYAFDATAVAAIPLVMQRLGGNVLIGSTTDNGAKLQVTGSISATGQVEGATLRVNVTPTAETPSATHTAVFNINGTNYKFLCLAA